MISYGQNKATQPIQIGNKMNSSSDEEKSQLNQKIEKMYSSLLEKLPDQD